MGEPDKPLHHLDRSVSDNFTLHTAIVHPQPAKPPDPAYVRPSNRIWIPAHYDQDKQQQSFGNSAANIRGGPKATGRASGGNKESMMELKPLAPKNYPPVFSVSNATAAAPHEGGGRGETPLLETRGLTTSDDPYSGGLPFRSLSDKDKPFRRGGSAGNRRPLRGGTTDAATSTIPMSPLGPARRANSTPLYPLSPTKPRTADGLSLSGLEHDVDDIISKIPAIGKHRLLLNISKYPGLVSVICGAYMLWSQGDAITDSQEALSIISIICGAYTFVSWVFGQVNHMTTYQAIKNHVWAKVVQSIGIVILSLGDICVVLLVIKDLRNMGGNSSTTVTPPSSTSGATIAVAASKFGKTLVGGGSLAGGNVVDITTMTSSSTTLDPFVKSGDSGIDLTVLCVVLLVSATIIFLLSIAELFFGVSSIRAVTSLCSVPRTISYDVVDGSSKPIARSSILKSNKVKPKANKMPPEAMRLDDRVF